MIVQILTTLPKNKFLFLFLALLVFLPKHTFAVNEPATISGTIGWYDIASTTSYNPSSPTVLNDLSGQGQNLSVVTGPVTYNPFGSLPMLSFGNANKLNGNFTIGTSTPLTAYIVFVLSTSTVGYQGIPLSYVSGSDGCDACGASSSRLLDTGGITTSLFTIRSTDSGAVTNNLQVNQGEVVLYSVTYNGSTAAAFLNGRWARTTTSPNYLGSQGHLEIGDSYLYEPYSTWFRGRVGEVVIRNTADATSTRQQFESYFNTKWGIKNTVNAQDVWGFGDSITAGSNGTDALNSWLAVFPNLSYPLANSISTRNVGVYGAVSSSANTQYNNTIKPYYSSGNTVISAYGSNDLTTGGTSASILSNMTSIWSDMKSRGMRVYVADILPRTQAGFNETQAAIYNANIDNLVSAGTVAGHIRYRNDTRLSSSTNTTYFTDATHPTQAGYNIMAQIVSDTLYGAIPSNIASTTASTTATITWTTNASSTSQVEYGTTSTYTASSSLNTATTTSHTMDLSGLVPNTTYHYRILSVNYLTDLATSTDKTFTTTSVSAPTISAVASTTAATTATITWTTNIASDSYVNYGPTSSYGASSTLDASLVTSHSQTLTGLPSCTTYHFQVVSSYTYSPQATSSDATFLTTGCTGSSAVATSTDSTISTSGGGSLSMGNLSLIVPAGFTGVSSSANFQVKSIDSISFSASAGIPSGMTRMIGTDVFNLIAIAGTSTVVSTFDLPLIITMTYSPSDVSGIDTSTLKIYRYDGATWTALSGCSVDISAYTVTCTTQNFSDFAIFGSAPVSNSTSAPTGPTAWGIFFGCKDPKAINYNYFSASNPSLCQYSRTVITPKILFSRDLKLNMKGEDVKALQAFLNNHGYPVSTKGAGSVGKETTFFGPATEKALIKFQKAKSIKPAVGYFGPVTRKYIINSY